jgi:hypothetical protein
MGDPHEKGYQIASAVNGQGSDHSHLLRQQWIASVNCLE